MADISHSKIIVSKHTEHESAIFSFVQTFCWSLQIPKIKSLQPSVIEYRQFYQNHVQIALSVRHASFFSFHSYIIIQGLLKSRYWVWSTKNINKWKKISKKNNIFATISAKLTSLVQNRFIKNVVNDFYVTLLHVKSIPDANMLWNRPVRSTVNLAGLSRDLSK